MHRSALRRNAFGRRKKSVVLPIQCWCYSSKFCTKVIQVFKQLIFFFFTCPIPFQHFFLAFNIFLLIISNSCSIFNTPSFQTNGIQEEFQFKNHLRSLAVLKNWKRRKTFYLILALPIRDTTLKPEITIPNPYQYWQ